jgi:4a-hydroxytetrahydrobiopterin dehydratase
MKNLLEKKCIPCSGGVPPLNNDDKSLFKEQISTQWSFSNEGKRLSLKLKLSDFKKSIELANQVGELAEREWHHPEMRIGFGHLDIEIWTHKIDDLVESDFIFAAKVDLIVKDYLEK